MDFLNFLLSLPFEKFLPTLKLVFGVFSIFFLGALIFFLIQSSWLKRIILHDLVEFFTYRPYGVRKIEKTWAKITGRLEANLESESKLAVIEADSMLNDILKRIGYGGETLGERLEKLTSSILPNIEQIWQAHKIRNNIVHDPDYRLTGDEAKRLLAIYEQALRDLQAL